MVRGNKHKCYYCGQEEDYTADHFYPKSKGGMTKVYACNLCQRTKVDMTPLQFLSYMNNHIAIREEVKQRITTAITTLIEFLSKEKTKK
jgi:hypothetical protein